MRRLFACGTFLIAIFSTYSCNAQNELEQLEFAKIFVSHFSDYQMNIRSAGVATIPIATLSDENELYIEYAYQSESEDRNGKMTLSRKHKTNRFEGKWKTVANNGNVYQGDLYFLFEDNGQADGFYQFNGTNYKITIFKK